MKRPFGLYNRNMKTILKRSITLNNLVYQNVRSIFVRTEKHVIELFVCNYYCGGPLITSSDLISIIKTTRVELHNFSTSILVCRKKNNWHLVWKSILKISNQCINKEQFMVKKTIWKWSPLKRNKTEVRRCL